MSGRPPGCEVYAMGWDHSGGGARPGKALKGQIMYTQDVGHDWGFMERMTQGIFITVADTHKMELRNRYVGRSIYNFPMPTAKPVGNKIMVTCRMRKELGQGLLDHHFPFFTEFYADHIVTLERYFFSLEFYTGQQVHDFRSELIDKCKLEVGPRYVIQPEVVDQVVAKGCRDSIGRNDFAPLVIDRGAHGAL